MFVRPFLIEEQRISLLDRNHALEVGLCSTNNFFPFSAFLSSFSSQVALSLSLDFLYC